MKATNNESKARCARRGLFVLLLGLLSTAAAAHDTWFEMLADGTLALGTGNQFPKRESGIAPDFLRPSGCSPARANAGDAGTQPLKVRGNVDTAVLLEVPPRVASCWAQLTAFEIELQPDKIGVYIDEIRPPQALLAAWAALQHRGLPWIERYTKHARIEITADGDASPSDMDMDALLLHSGGKGPTVGARLDVVVLRRGKPLPDFNVQFRSERTPFGFWRRTDSDGRVDFQPPLAGRWLLRGVDIRLSTTRPDTFESDFLTLAFDVVAAKRATP